VDGKSCVMSFADKFEDLRLWQEARSLANEIYNAFEALSRKNSEFKLATVWICLVCEKIQHNTRAPHGSPNGDRRIR
jgi:hypothetical protein